MRCNQSYSGRKRRAIEQLLEDESLTADLGDEAAKLLLDWVTAQLDAARQPAEEPSQTDLGARISRLRRLMRRVNTRAGQASADQQAERVRTILSRLEERGDVDVDQADQSKTDENRRSDPGSTPLD
jgi:hypothetical protein